MKDREKIARLKEDANTAKEKLISIAQQLYQEGAIRESQSLETIIGKLEQWQNK